MTIRQLRRSESFLRIDRFEAFFGLAELTLQVLRTKQIFAFGAVGVRCLLNLFESLLAGVLIWHELHCRRNV